MNVVAELDENQQPYLVGYILCSQLSKARRVRFYLDTGSTVTTLLSIDIVRLGLNWSNLLKTKCNTAVGIAEAHVLPSATVLLKTSENNEEELVPYTLNAVHLLPPEDLTEVFPIEYEFAFSLLGMDVLRNFKTWNWNYRAKQVVLET